MGRLAQPERVCLAAGIGLGIFKNLTMPHNFMLDVVHCMVSYIPANLEPRPESSDIFDLHLEVNSGLVVSVAHTSRISAFADHTE